MLLPNEAVMSDDQIQARKSQSDYQQMLAYRNSLSGEGASLSPAGRENLYQTMTNLAESRVDELDRMTENAVNLATGTGVEPGLVTGRSIARKPRFRETTKIPSAERKRGEQWEADGFQFIKDDTGAIYRKALP